MQVPLEQRELMLHTAVIYRISNFQHNPAHQGRIFRYLKSHGSVQSGTQHALQAGLLILGQLRIDTGVHRSDSLGLIDQDQKPAQNYAEQRFSASLNQHLQENAASRRGHVQQAGSAK